VNLLCEPHTRILSTFETFTDFLTGGLGHLRKTTKKQTPSEETLALIKASKIYQLESEFYRFAKQQFEFLKQGALQKDDEDRLVLQILILKARYRLGPIQNPHHLFPPWDPVAVMLKLPSKHISKSVTERHFICICMRL